MRRLSYLKTIVILTSIVISILIMLSMTSFAQEPKEKERYPAVLYVVKWELLPDKYESYMNWAFDESKGALKRGLNVPNLMEFHGYVAQLSSEPYQLMGVSGFSSLTKWAEWYQKEDVQKIFSEIRFYTSKLTFELWGPSPLITKPIRSNKVESQGEKGERRILNIWKWNVIPQKTEEYYKWIQSAVTRVLNTPEVIELRAYRPVSGESQVILTLEFSDFTTWSKWYSHEDIKKLRDELKSYASGINTDIWSEVTRYRFEE